MVFDILACLTSSPFTSIIEVPMFALSLNTFKAFLTWSGMVSSQGPHAIREGEVAWPQDSVNFVVYAFTKT